MTFNMKFISCSRLIYFITYHSHNKIEDINTFGRSIAKNDKIKNFVLTLSDNKIKQFNDFGKSLAKNSSLR